MFVGHYAVSLAAKAADKRIPLWVLFLATQAVDVLWAVLVLVGIEKVRIVPGITAANPLDLYYFPYTHSLLASFLWLGVAMVGYRVLRPGEGSWRLGLIVGLVVFSHWILDFLVHRPDLPVYDDALKVGLGLWNYPLISFLLEAGLLLGGLWIYLQATTPVGATGRYGMLGFALVLLLIQVGYVLGPLPPSSSAVAGIGLASYAVFAGVAYWLDKKRT